METFPETRGNHTDARACARVQKLPMCIQEYIWTNDPSWSAVPKGWHDIVVDLHQHILQVVPDYRIIQIKEKFGSLRVYATCSTNVIADAIVSHYQELSTKTCDVCGKPGRITNNKRVFAARCIDHALKF